MNSQRLGRQQCNSQLRHGFTLSELSVAMVAGSSIMLLSISMVHHSFKWTKMIRHRVSADQSFDRLQKQFRSDAHVASQGQLDNSGKLILTHANQTVAYAVDGGAVHRVVTQGEQASHETYRLGDDFRASLTLADEPKRIVLSTKRILPTAKAGSPILEEFSVWRHVEAVLGRRLNLETARGER